MGDESLTLDKEFVRKSVELLSSSCFSPCHGLDFGVLDNGETAVMEWNDGYALASYGLNPHVFYGSFGCSMERAHGFAFKWRAEEARSAASDD